MLFIKVKLSIVFSFKDIEKFHIRVIQEDGNRVVNT